MRKEPVALPGLILAAIEALVGLATAFGADLTAEQTGAILTAAGAITAVVVFIVRGKVWSPETVERRLDHGPEGSEGQ